MQFHQPRRVVGVEMGFGYSNLSSNPHACCHIQARESRGVTYE
jgi:hypothetical protein